MPVAWTDGRTDGRTPDRYITLSGFHGQCNNFITKYTKSISNSDVTVVAISWHRWTHRTSQSMGSIRKKYVRPPNTRMEMYAGRVTCCLLVSHVEYAPRVLLRLGKKTQRALLMLEKKTRNRKTRQTVTLRFMLDAANVIIYITQITIKRFTQYHHQRFYYEQTTIEFYPS